ncbi:hypothetical protein FACS1894171_0780 [Clostridia bacterium]|nr:hypothetical protein FACS1894171_0780 [Clostridia bacterium]
MREKIYKLKLDSAERGAIITALVELRNKRITEGKSIEFVNEVIIKINDT